MVANDLHIPSQINKPFGGCALCTSAKGLFFDYSAPIFAREPQEVHRVIAYKCGANVMGIQLNQRLIQSAIQYPETLLCNLF